VSFILQHGRRFHKNIPIQRPAEKHQMPFAAESSKHIYKNNYGACHKASCTSVNLKGAPSEWVWLGECELIGLAPLQ